MTGWGREDQRYQSEIQASERARAPSKYRHCSGVQFPEFEQVWMNVRSPSQKCDGQAEVLALAESLAPRHKIGTSASSRFDIHIVCDIVFQKEKLTSPNRLDCVVLWTSHGLGRLPVKKEKTESFRKLRPSLSLPDEFFHFLDNISTPLHSPIFWLYRVLTLFPSTAIVIIMKNSQVLLSKVLLPAVIATMVSSVPQNAAAGFPVTDSGVISQLIKLNLTAAKIQTDTAAINASSAKTASNTTQIMKDTAQINQTTLATLPKIQEDIQKMREIGEARQKLTLQITKLSQLTTKGDVFKEDPFVNAVATSGVDSMTQILTEMGEYMTQPQDLLGDPGLDSVTEDQMATNSFSADTQLSYKFDEANTLITPNEAGMSEVRNKLESLFGLSYNGLGFVGKNANYMQSMIGHGGRPLNFDYIPPVGSISLSETQKSRLKNLRSSAFNDVLRNHIRENYRRASQAGENPWEVAPGLYIRPKTEADALFEKMVLSEEATPGTEVAFYAAASHYSKTQYHPFWGFSENAELSLPINVNDVLTRGAYDAVQEYLSQKGADVSDNPYGNFGKSIAPIVAELVNKTAPGRNLVVTEADIERAAQSPGLSLKGVPSTPQEWRNMFARSEKAQNDYIRATTSGVPAPSDEEEIMVLFGLNKKDTKTYNAKLLANSTRLSQNNKTLLTQVCLLNYNQRALDAVVEMENALTGLSSSATELNVVEMLPMLRDNAQNTILVLQNRIGQLQAQVDSLLKDKHEALADRQKTIEQYQKIIIDESKAQVERIMMGTAPTSLSM